jgi:hypothetical protein
MIACYVSSTTISNYFYREMMVSQAITLLDCSLETHVLVKGEDQQLHTGSGSMYMRHV